MVQKLISDPYAQRQCNQAPYLTDLYRDFQELYGLAGNYLCLTRPNEHLGLIQQPIRIASLKNYLLQICTADKVEKKFGFGRLNEYPILSVSRRGQPYNSIGGYRIPTSLDSKAFERIFDQVTDLLVWKTAKLINSITITLDDNFKQRGKDLWGERFIDIPGLCGLELDVPYFDLVKQKEMLLFAFMGLQAAEFDA
jgi:hypothetical protein